MDGHTTTAYTMLAYCRAVKVLQMDSYTVSLSSIGHFYLMLFETQGTESLEDVGRGHCIV